MIYTEGVSHCEASSPSSCACHAPSLHALLSNEVTDLFIVLMMLPRIEWRLFSCPQMLAVLFSLLTSLGLYQFYKSTSGGKESVEEDKRYQELLLGGYCKRKWSENLDCCTGKKTTKEMSFLRAGATWSMLLDNGFLTPNDLFSNIYAILEFLIV